MPAEPVRKRARVYRYLLPAALAVATGAAAHAQFVQYRSPGQIEEAEPSPDPATVAQDARWRLGPVSLDPLLSVRDIGWVQNLYAASSQDEQISDLRATLGAGLVSYLPLGRSFLLSAFVLPEYVWWNERKDLRQLNWNSGIRTKAHFNRLDVELTGRRLERDQFLNSEAEVPVEIDRESITIGIEADPRGPFSVFGAAGQADVENRSADRAATAALLLEDLDRRETWARAGVGYQLASGWRIDLGLDVTETDFRRRSAARSNRSTGPLLRAEFDGSRIDLRFEAVAHRLKYDSGEDGREVLGGAQVGFNLTPRLSLTPYVRRQLVYSARDERSVFVEQRQGVVVSHQTTSRLRFSAFVDRGRSEFEGIAGGGTTRVDDLGSYGAGMDATLTPRLSLRLGAVRVTYDSVVPELDRNASRITTEIRLTGFDLLAD